MGEAPAGAAGECVGHPCGGMPALEQPCLPDTSIGSYPWCVPAGGHHAAAVPEGAVMTVTADRAAAGRSGARASGRGPARAAAAEPLSRGERVARGKDARAVAPLEAHAEFRPGESRDPVGLLLAQAASRVPELVPVRHGR